MPESAAREFRRRHNLSERLVQSHGWYHSFELPGGVIIEGAQTLDYQKERWARFSLPASLEGKRVLDIGAWDGWFSFEAERRGASVTAVDCIEVANCLEVRERLSSRVDYRILGV